MSDLNFAAGGVLENRRDLAAHPMLEVVGLRVPVQAKKDDQDENSKRDKEPAEEPGDTMISRTRLALRGGGRGRLDRDLWRVGIAHGASSPGCRTVMLP